MATRRRPSLKETMANRFHVNFRAAGRPPGVIPQGGGGLAKPKVKLFGFLDEDVDNVYYTISHTTMMLTRITIPRRP